MQILVSLRVFGVDSHYILSIQISLMAVHKEIYKKCSDVCLSMVAFRVQFKLKPHPHWSPLGVIYQPSRQNLRILMMSSWYFG